MKALLSRLFGRKTEKCVGNVLVVDDEPAIRELMKFRLEEHNLKVFTAASVQEAEEILAKEKETFRLVVLDIMMPGENGLLLAKRLRKRKETARVPILILSGAVPPSKLEEMRDEFTYTEALNKPVKAADLNEAVERALKTGFAK
jgi:CheY-like chemotaxis protein